MLESNPRNKKALIIAAVAAVLLLGGVGYLIWQDWNAIEATEKEKQGLIQEVSRARQEISRIPKLEEQVLVLRNKVRQSVAILPDDEEIHSLVDQMTRFSDDSGVVIDELDSADLRNRAARGRRGRKKEAFDRVTYKLKVRGSFEQLLSFIDHFENKYPRFVRVKTLKFKSDTNPQGKEEIKPHQADLEIETYVYNHKGKDRVKIVNERSKVEHLTRKGLMEIETGDAKPARYDFEGARKRRDPLRDPRLAVSSLKVNPEDRKLQSDALENLRRRVQEIRAAIIGESDITDMVKRYQQIRTTNESMRKLATDVSRAREEEIFTIPEMEKRFKAEVEEPFWTLAKGRDLDGRALDIPASELAGRLEAMKSSFKRGRYKEVMRLWSEVGGLSKLASDGSDLARFFQEAEPIKAKAESMIEWEGLELAVQGVIVDFGHPERSVAIINTKAYSAGEMIQPGLMLKSISQFEVTFEFKGMIVKRRVREGRRSSQGN